MKLNTPGLRQAMTDIGIFSFVINALMLVMPLYLLQVYDRVLPSNRTETLMFLSVIAVFAYLCLGVFEAVRSAYAARVANRFDMENSKPAFLAALTGPRASDGDIQPLRDLSSIRRTLSSKLAFLVFDLPFAPLFIGILYFIHPLLFWLTVGGVVLMMLIAVINQKVISKRSKESGRQLIAGFSLAEAVTRNGDTVRALGMTESAIGRWAGLHMPYMESNDWTQRVSAWFSGMSRAIRMILQIGILGVGAWLVLNQQMTAGMIFAASIISGRGLQPIDQLINSWPQLLEVRQTINRLETSLAPIVPVKRFDPVPQLRGAIQAENLVYRLPHAGPNEAPIIKAVSFRVRPGETVCIVGPNGAGKSTLLRMVAGALPNTLGFIRYDGADIKSYSPDDLGRKIGYLAQSVEMLPGTIFENISRFDPEATSEAVEKAARMANVFDEVSALPNGFNTRLGSEAYRPSGGHMQRLGVARALYGDPSLVFLDEPNANLDQDAHKLLVATLRTLRENRVTIIMVTQRDEILPISDRIMVMQTGQIREFDETGEMLKKYKPELYKTLERAKHANPNAQSGEGRDQQQSKESSVVQLQPGSRPRSRDGTRQSAPDADARPPQESGEDAKKPSTARTNNASTQRAPDQSSKSPFAGLGPGLRPISGSNSAPDAGPEKDDNEDAGGKS